MLREQSRSRACSELSLGMALLLGLLYVIVKYLFYNEIGSIEDIVKYIDNHLNDKNDIQNKIIR